MSSRSIEGENPLYLPQAKSMMESAALGPCIYIPETTHFPPIVRITIEIKRNDKIECQRKYRHQSHETRP
jgi:2-dehydro-3-deoxy-D-arabinonate dehydratase